MGEGGGSLVISRAAKIELCQQQLRGKPSLMMRILLLFIVMVMIIMVMVVMVMMMMVSIPN